MILSVAVCLRLAEVLLLRGDAATLPAPGGLGNLEHFAIIRFDPLYGRSWYTGQYHCMVLVTIAVPVVLSIVVFCLITILLESRGRSAATTSTVRNGQHAQVGLTWHALLPTVLMALLASYRSRLVLLAIVVDTVPCWIIRITKVGKYARKPLSPLRR